jgi:Tfp pilus assembly protein PilF
MGTPIVSRIPALASGLILLMAVGLTACASMEKEKEVQRLRARAAYEQALKHLQEQRISLGMASLQQAISLDPENALYHNALGVVLLDVRRPADAQAEFQRALDLDRDYAEAHHNLGLAYAEQGKFTEAIAGYHKALSLPTYATQEVAYNNLGNAYFALGKFREAEDSYRAALRLDNRMPSALYGLGMVLSREGRQEEAKAALRMARDIGTTSPFGRAAAEVLKTMGEP